MLIQPANNLPSPSQEAAQHSARLVEFIRHDIAARGGWISFARYMELALYAPGLGYYTAGAHKFGEAGDFVTAPELSPLFGRTLARQAAEIMARSAPHILELGAGSGKLAADMLGELERLGNLPDSYTILEVSADLRARQQTLLGERLPHLMDRVHWLDALPDQLSGAVIANEVLDALPVHLVHWRAVDVGRDLSRHGGDVGINPDLQNRDRAINERGVSIGDNGFIWQDRAIGDAALLHTARQIAAPNEHGNDVAPDNETRHARPPHLNPLPQAGEEANESLREFHINDYVSEICLAAHGLINSLASRLEQGAMLFIDYGFGAREFYHPQRDSGTLMCHYRHRAHDDPFFLPGLQDITAHANFTAIAECGIDAGLELLGYTSQAFFLINCGIAELMRDTSPENLRDYLPLSAQLQKLTSPAEMGELFKVIALGKNMAGPLCGFARGDLSRSL
ncbi:MAG: class I SAM-dependent methyltransferase [Gallionella sp.]|nr:MAG: class I SAM-dependent methyltransferase [Gallionella sp.]